MILQQKSLKIGVDELRYIITYCMYSINGDLAGKIYSVSRGCYTIADENGKVKVSDMMKFFEDNVPGLSEHIKELNTQVHHYIFTNERKQIVYDFLDTPIGREPLKRSRKLFPSLKNNDALEVVTKYVKLMISENESYYLNDNVLGNIGILYGGAIDKACRKFSDNIQSEGRVRGNQVQIDGKTLSQESLFEISSEFDIDFPEVVRDIYQAGVLLFKVGQVVHYDLFSMYKAQYVQSRKMALEEATKIPNVEFVFRDLELYGNGEITSYQENSVKASCELMMVLQRLLEVNPARQNLGRIAQELVSVSFKQQNIKNRLKVFRSEYTTEESRERFYTLLKGHNALRRLLGYISAHRISIFDIPTKIFRDETLIDRFSSLESYMESIELVEELNRGEEMNYFLESRGVIQNTELARQIRQKALKEIGGATLQDYIMFKRNPKNKPVLLGKDVIPSKEDLDARVKSSVGRDGEQIGYGQIFGDKLAHLEEFLNMVQCSIDEIDKFYQGCVANATNDETAVTALNGKVSLVNTESKFPKVNVDLLRKTTFVKAQKIIVDAYNRGDFAGQDPKVKLKQFLDDCVENQTNPFGSVSTGVVAGLDLNKGVPMVVDLSDYGVDINSMEGNKFYTNRLRLVSFGRAVHQNMKDICDKISECKNSYDFFALFKEADELFPRKLLASSTEIETVTGQYPYNVYLEVEGEGSNSFIESQEVKSLCSSIYSFIFDAFLKEIWELMDYIAGFLDKAYSSRIKAGKIYDVKLQYIGTFLLNNISTTSDEIDEYVTRMQKGNIYDCMKQVENRISHEVTDDEFGYILFDGVPVRGMDEASDRGNIYLLHKTGRWVIEVSSNNMDSNVKDLSQERTRTIAQLGSIERAIHTYYKYTGKINN